MDLELKKCEKEIRELCFYRIRILLNRDDVYTTNNMISQIIKITTENALKQYLNEQLRGTDQKQFNTFLVELIPKKKKQWEIESQISNRIRRVETGPVTMDGLRVYKKQEDFVEAPLSKKKKSSKKNARKKEIREISNRLKSEERIQCDCQATEHELIGNCLSCGKIICEREGEGSCLFCGSLSENKAMTEKEMEDYQRAVAMNEKLLNFDKENAARTSVLDDQEDHFSYQNKWLSKEERDDIKRKEEELEREREENKRKIFISIDIAGRKIIHQTANEVRKAELAKVEQKFAKINLDIQHNVLEKRKEEGSSGLFVNPFLDPSIAPKFVKVDEPKKNQPKKLHAESAPQFPETLSCAVNPKQNSKENNPKSNNNIQKTKKNPKKPKLRVQNDWEEDIDIDNM